MKISEELESAASVRAMINELESIKSQVSDLIGDSESAYVRYVLEQLGLDCMRLKLRMIDAANELTGMHNAQNRELSSSPK